MISNVVKNKIVVIDDDIELLAELEFILDEEGYEVCALETITLINNLQQLEPDLLILDVWFGTNKAGLTLAKNIKQTQSLRQVPLILVSSDPKVNQYALEVNADKYLEKPINIDELIINIQTILT